jgi:hypothetical protein
MIRIVIENVLLFLLPTAMYLAYVLLTRRHTSPTSAMMGDAPLIWLFAAGAVLVVGTLTYYGSTSGGRPGQVYVPPHMGKDGHIEPGHMQ